MGRSKEFWMRWQDDESMRDWVEQRYGILNEGSDEWFDAVNEYLLKLSQEELQERLDWEQYEYDYFLRRSVEEAFENFLHDIDELLKMLEQATEDLLTPTFLKMIYAHSVTVMEVFLEDAVKGLVASNPAYLKNTIRNVQPFRSECFNLNDISLEEDGIKMFVLGKLSDNLFHNIPKSIKILSGILDKNIDVDMKGICKITSIRHDNVHRNGKNKDGELIDVSGEVVVEAVSTIRKFVTGIRFSIPETIEEEYS